MDRGSNKNHSPVNSFAPRVTKFCVMWEGLSLPHDTEFGNCRGKIVDSRAFPIWSLIHGLSWSGPVFWFSAGSLARRQQLWWQACNLTCLTHPPWTKWPPFWQTTFSNAFSRIIKFRFKLHWIYSQEASWQYTSIGSGNGLPPKRRQAITGNDDVPVPWRIYAALGEMS